MGPNDASRRLGPPYVLSVAERRFGGWCSGCRGGVDVVGVSVGRRWHWCRLALALVSAGVGVGVSWRWRWGRLALALACVVGASASGQRRYQKVRF